MSLQRRETSLCSKQLACVSGFQALLQTLSGRLLPFPILRWSGQLLSSYLYNSCWPSPSNYEQGRRLCWAEGWWVWSFFEGNLPTGVNKTRIAPDSRQWTVSAEPQHRPCVLGWAMVLYWFQLSRTDLQQHRPLSVYGCACLLAELLYFWA